jgi:transcriptional regulator with XRE-family HTH domain
MRGLSQRQLGELIGLGKVTGGVRINRYEQQTSQADLKTAAELAAALKVPMAFLFADSERMALHILRFE